MRRRGNREKNRRKRRYGMGGRTTLPVLLLLAGLVSLIAVLYVGVSYQMEDISLEKGEVQSFREGWSCAEHGEPAETGCLGREGNSSHQKDLRIVNRLPSLSSDTVLCVSSNHVSMRIFAGGTLLYTYEWGNDDIIGNVWLLVDIPRSLQGQTIEIEMHSTLPISASLPAEITLGSKTATVFYLFEQNIGRLLFCAFMLLLGVVFLLFVGILKWKKLEYNRRAIFYLGIFVLFACFWTLTDSQLLQFVCGNKAVGYTASFLLFQLQPVPFLLFLKENLPRGRKGFNIFCTLFLLNLFCTLAFCVVGNVHLSHTLLPTHLLIGATILFVAVFCIRERFVYHNAEVKGYLWGMGALCLCSVAALLEFYMGSQRDNSRFFRYGLLLFIGILSVSSFKKSITLLRSSMEARTYRRLAFVDGMTQLGNRAKFDREMDRLRDVPENEILFVVFDLNNLKKGNDTMGHTAGDDLIRGAASCIREVFEQDGKCFRIGGDEFTVILEQAEGRDVGRDLDRLHAAVKLYNAEHGCTVDLAYGYARGHSAEAGRLFEQADAEMYRQKQNRLSNSQL